MGQEQPLFSLISSQPEALAAWLKPHLEHLKPDSIRYLTPGALATVVLGPHEALIVDFTSFDADPRAGIAWSKLKNHPVLGLLPAEEIEIPSQRTQGCSEVIAWPGVHEELAAKLQRLQRLASAGRRIEQTLLLKINLIGESEAFRKVMSDIGKYCKCDAPVLILGETGTGKEMIARAIHYQGLEDGKPFVAVNCGALPDNLVENELFGHAKGAYTDARQAQCGLVEQAKGGTLFLDEIEALSAKGQVALLRFLQDYEFRPLGASRSRRAQLRLITASNEPLEHLVAQGFFRRDLFYRINILRLCLPPLHERGNDVVMLAEHFVSRYREIYQQYDKYLDPNTLRWMVHYDWPGNVRELENLILREFLLSDSSCISIQPLSAAVGEGRSNICERRFGDLYDRNFQDAKSTVVQEFERSYLQYVLQEANGNVSQAARQAGKERRTFDKLLEKHGISRKQFVSE
ncbi:MAG: sigma-54 dependent transcriptional regulator [Gammaproteobacteria bacterium]|nr:sigma-54 dependent transcriptional regulator [Gammaproteobacteria bacterium]